MVKSYTLASALCFMWSGVSLGGALVATPAKFQAPSLELATALEVGRAQFAWMGYTEYALMAILILIVLTSVKHIKWWWIVIPIGFFLIQKIGIMPRLDLLTVQRIAGGSENTGNLHHIYIVVEIAKFISLIAAGLLTSTPRIPD